MAIMSDNKSNGPQFSKIIVLTCLIIGIVGMIGTVAVSLLFPLSEAIGCAAVGIFGTITTTAVLFYMKKSQSENTTRMYVEAYKEISEIKGDSSILDDLGESMIDKMSSSLDETLNDGTSMIEKVDN